MKPLIKLFFRTLRTILGPILLLKEKLTRPAAIVRNGEAQAKIDLACQTLVLYQFASCPFCIKVRREMHRLSLPITINDAQKNPVNRQELFQQTGKTKVPCLKITKEDGSTLWMPESDDIIAYLRQQFA
jgi:glutaredoxin